MSFCCEYPTHFSLGMRLGALRSFQYYISENVLYGPAEIIKYLKHHIAWKKVVCHHENCTRRRFIWLVLYESLECSWCVSRGKNNLTIPICLISQNDLCVLWASARLEPIRKHHLNPLDVLTPQSLSFRVRNLWCKVRNRNCTFFYITFNNEEYREQKPEEWDNVGLNKSHP